MNVPKLRFKGFVGDWVSKQIIDFAPLQRGFDLPVSTIVEGEFPVVFSNGILKKHHQYKATAPGVVTGRSGTIGNVSYIENNYWPHNTALWVTDFLDNLPKFVFYFYVNFDLARFGTGSGVPTLNRNDVHRQVIHVPESLAEQTKIANFLTTIDEKISQLTQKYDLLAQYKKGVMQQIFSQKLRFKDEDGRGFPEWEVKKLKDVFTVKYGKDYKHLKEGNIPLLGTGGVMKYVNQHLYDKPSVLIGRKGTIDKPQFIQTPFWTVDTLFYTEIDECYSPYFVYLLVSQVDWYKYNEATGVPSLNTTAINNVVVRIPSDIQEQTKIANFLTAIDDKITHTQAQLNAVKLYKKGLLQQLFV